MVGSFGDSPDMATERVNLVSAATASLMDGLLTLGL